NDPHAFSKIGDSTIENPHFLARFDVGPYNLGEYVYLQPVIDYFAGSYGRQSITVQRGLHTWSVFDPTWADPAQCEPNETAIACEFRLHRPSAVLIRLGANDPGLPDLFTDNLRHIVTYSLEQGVIPVLGTKSDRREGPTLDYNMIIRGMAAEYEVPLWDFDLVAQTLPDRGLTSDLVHMSFFWAHDYHQDLALRRGHGVHNLTALMMLDALWWEIAPNRPDSGPVDEQHPPTSGTPTTTPDRTALPTVLPTATPTAEGSATPATQDTNTPPVTQ
ncbi:MAG: hypothetical protein JW910_07505, partial [Anaerolineae bacterium]|nr:hypothetical protein [Anaerolineae bacterium]